LLAPTSSSPSVDEVAWADPARLEADISSQLYMGTLMLPVRDDYAPVLVRNELVRSVYSSSSTYALSSPPLASIHTPSTSYSWLNDMIGQPTAVVVNPPLFSVGNHSTHSVDLGLGVFGGVPCDLPREVVWDALAMSLGSPRSASSSGKVDNRCERVSILCIMIGH